MTRRELLIFAAGAIALCGLGTLLYTNTRTPASASALVESAFVVPDFAKGNGFHLNGLRLSVDRERKRACAYREKDGSLAWESNGMDGFIVPGAAFSMDLTPDGQLWVANVGRKRLEQLDPQTGKFIAFWQPAKAFGGCCNPVCFAALAGGRFVTMEKGTRQAVVYLPSGEVERVVSASLSNSEYNYFLGRDGRSVHLYDIGTKQHWEVGYDVSP